MNDYILLFRRVSPIFVMKTPDVFIYSFRLSYRWHVGSINRSQKLVSVVFIAMKRLSLCPLCIIHQGANIQCDIFDLLSTSELTQYDSNSKGAKITPLGCGPLTTALTGKVNSLIRGTETGVITTPI